MTQYTQHFYQIGKRQQQENARQELIRRWDSERELYNDNIAHT